MKKLLWQVLLISTLALPACAAGLSSDELVKIIYDANVVDRRIAVEVSLDDHQATVSLFVNRDSSTFEYDSKVAALKIAKSLLDADSSITSTIVQFKSQKLNDFKQVLVGGGDVTAYSAGRKTKDEIATGLEFVTVPVSKEQPPVSAISAPAAKNGDSMAVGEGSGTTGGEHNADASAENVSTLGSKLEDDSSGSSVAGASVPNATVANPGQGKNSSNAKAIFAAPPASAKDKLFVSGKIAFYYPPTWVQRPVSRNDWATPDELGIAELACRTRMGVPFITIARFTRIGLRERLRTEAELGTAFGLEVSEAERIRIGYRGGVPAVSVLSTGRQGLIYFKRIYFNIGSELYAITLRCKAVEAPALERDFTRLLGTLHSPAPKKP